VSTPVDGADRSVGTAWVDVGLSLFFVIVGGLAIHDSIRLGYGWGMDGPQAGYFPFLIGCALIGGALVNAVQAIRSRGTDDVFVTFGQAQSVAVLLVPTLIYVLAIPYLGIYLASAILAFGFVRFLGNMSWIASGAIATTIAVVCFVLFDKWFLVSLPKGPIEALLGY
jgi:putative tricarboxylic transport membrane protein